MRINKLFTFGLAALAFAACSKEEGSAGDGQKGELVDAISIKFTGNVNTRADGGTQNGKGSENNIYVAYVFAREAAPEHVGAMPGDWTVKRVIANPVADKDLTDNEIVTAIGGTATTDPEAPKLGAMATFKGVQLGDKVYVIVNDPNMDYNYAQVLAHKGAATEAAIVDYVTNVSKTALNKLTIKKDELQAGHFTMAGLATIPTNPNTPNGETVVVPVELNRESAKVRYTGAVTADRQYDAYNQLEFKDGDGIIVVRIPRAVSFFTERERDWYYPAKYDETTEDWVKTWLNAFDGQNETVLGAAAANAGFNTLEPALTTAKEYRLTWAAKAADNTTNLMEIQDKVISSPFFYVTPNYSKSASCATVICTQASYIGAPVFANADAQKVFTSCYNKYAITADFKDALGVIAYKDLAWKDVHLTAAKTYLIEGNKTEIAATSGLDETAVSAALLLIAKATAINAAGTDNVLSCYQGMKRFYRVDVADYEDDLATSKLITERNTFYQIKGTITSFGAATISDAVNTDNIGMTVEVKVMPWNVKLVNVNM